MRIEDYDTPAEDTMVDIVALTLSPWIIKDDQPAATRCAKLVLAALAAYAGDQS